MTESTTPATADFPLLPLVDGPWSFAEAPSDHAFIGFGILKLPAVPNLQARVDVDKTTRKVGAISVKIDDCLLQLRVLAAPRAYNVWPELRRALSKEASRYGGTSQAAEGHFGTELIVTVPVPVPGGFPIGVTTRYVGAAGERWLIRASVVGRSSLSDATVAKVDAFLSQCAVDRGEVPFGVGAVIPLGFPEGEADVEGALARKAAAKVSATPKVPVAKKGSTTPKTPVAKKSAAAPAASAPKPRAKKAGETA